MKTTTLQWSPFHRHVAMTATRAAYAVWMHWTAEEGRGSPVIGQGHRQRQQEEKRRKRTASAARLQTPIVVA